MQADIITPSQVFPEVAGGGAYQGAAKVSWRVLFDEEPPSNFYKGLRPKLAIITEESNFDIVTQQKGGYVLEIKVYGEKAHSSGPWKGNNAINKAIKIYQDFEKIILLSKKTNSFPPTINIGKFNGGINSNFVADLASFETDIRFTNKTNQKKIRNKINSLKKRKDIDIAIKSYKTIMKSRNCEKQIKLLQGLVKKYLFDKP